ncbi:hypothetical protein Cantr_05598 [Candida viswanathii]|uniref:Uncharacterized protein n=1 Tax=Candida viswanathii TaxID=5486 RepID=A0A367XRE1_9ASCO|nr:hypothetical protein Cantr_05598 [Candida viswanathii]
MLPLASPFLSTALLVGQHYIASNLKEGDVPIREIIRETSGDWTAAAAVVEEFVRGGGARFEQFIAWVFLAKCIEQTVQKVWDTSEIYYGNEKE